MTHARTILPWATCAVLAATLACDRDCEPTPIGPGNQDPLSLEACPALPPGVEPIPGISVAWAEERFGGLSLTVSTRALVCGEPAVQNGYCRDQGDLGVSVGFAARQTVVGKQALRYPLYVEVETPDHWAVGGGGDLKDAAVEIFEITDTCVTGRFIDLAENGGPFDGGFVALRCER